MVPTAAMTGAWHKKCKGDCLNLEKGAPCKVHAIKRLADSWLLFYLMFKDNRATSWNEINDPELKFIRVHS